MIDIPGYKILRQLGRGGMATVYLAVQALVEREVALKVMAPQLSVDPSFGERFLREARIAARLRHPHIVAIIEVGVHGDYHYAAMEYLSGGQILRHDGDTLPLPAALRAVREIAQALDYAHGKGVVHRDVKPDNIFLREDGSAVLGDFGIARAVDASSAVTRTGAVVGTPIYMSPEQLRGRQVDGRSDLYSLGVVFHQLLLGHPPYIADDALALGIMHMTSPLPQLPPPYAIAQPLLARMLAKEPDDRCQSGAEVVAAIQQIERELASRPAGGSDVQPADAFAIELPDGDEPRVGDTRLADFRPGEGSRERRAEPSFGDIGAPAGEHWRVTPRPPGKLPRRRRLLPWLLLVTLLAAGAAGWQTRADWWPRAEIELSRWLGQDDPRLRAFEQARDDGRLLADAGEDGLAQLQALLSERPDDARALAALASVWPQLLDRLAELERDQPDAAARLRARLRSLRPQAAELAAPAAAVTTATAAGSTATTPPLDEGQRRADAEAALAAARSAERALRWYGEDGALALYRRALALMPDDGATRDGLARLIDRILIDAREALQRRRDAAPASAAYAAFADLEAAAPARAELERLLSLAERRTAGADRIQRLNTLLAEAERALAGQPDNATLKQVADRLVEGLSLDPRNTRLRGAIDNVVALLLLRAGELLERGDQAGASVLLGQVRELAPNSARLRELEVRVGGEG